MIDEGSESATTSCNKDGRFKGIGEWISKKKRSVKRINYSDECNMKTRSVKSVELNQ